MAFSRQELFTLFFYFLGYFRIRNLFFRLKGRPAVRFVTFHDILPSATKQFEANLLFLKHRTNVLSLDDFFKGNFSSNTTNVVITFDDGFKSWITQAIPILNKLHLPATFFVSSGSIGLEMEDAAYFAQTKLRTILDPGKMTGFLSCEDLRMIVEHGFVVGGHTINHSNLAASISDAQIRAEIVEDKKKLEMITGRQVTYFAYPLGTYHNSQTDVVNILKESGYRAAVTTIPGFNDSESSPFMLRRELTRATMHNWLFRSIVYGNGDATRYLKQLPKTICRKLVVGSVQ